MLMALLGIVAVGLTWRFKGFWAAVLVALGWVLLQLVLMVVLVAIYR